MVGLRNLSRILMFSLAEILRLALLSLCVGLSLSILEATAVALNGGLVLELGWDNMVANKKKNMMNSDCFE